MIVRNSTNQIQTESNIEVIDLFYIPLINGMIQEDTSDLESNIEFIPGSNQNQEQSKIDREKRNYRVLEKYPTTKKILLKYIRYSLKKLGYASDFDLSTSWCTKSIKGDSAPLHSHKNSWFSAVYYYGDYDEDCGKFFMNNPLYNLTSFNDKIVNVNNFNTPMTVIPPEKKKIIIFPSYVSHGVSTHYSNLTRYSLAFNIVPVGYYGNDNDGAYDTSWYCGRVKK